MDLITSRSNDCQVIYNTDALVDGEYKTYDLGFATVEAVQAGNNKNHDINVCVGWLVTLPGGISIYATGDTSTTDQMSELASRDIRAIAPGLHITAKINSSDFTYGGLDNDESLELCKLLTLSGIESIEVSGNGTSVSGIRAHVNEGYFLPFAARLAEAVDVPVIVVGGLRALDTMEAALGQTKIELISLSRPLLCEPNLPKKMQADPETVSRCVSCNRCYSSDAHKCVFRR